jgi:Alpha 1,4-glycosyltransferase conserved region
MLWVGPALGRIERLSISSFLQAGHKVRLHAYAKIKNVPAPVELCDAARLMPLAEAQALRHRKTGSFALASDLFRYRLMANGEGMWSDTDMVCLRPVTLEGPHIFGWESARHINGALLYLDSGSPLLADLLGNFRANHIPPWLGLKRSLPFRIKLLARKRFEPAELPWGTFGPRALTYMARRHGVSDQAQKRAVFYPLTLRDAPRIFETGFALPEDELKQAYAIHLWNERLKDIKDAAPAQGSMLDRLCEQFGV